LGRLGLAAAGFLTIVALIAVFSQYELLKNGSISPTRSDGANTDCNTALFIGHVF